MSTAIIVTFDTASDTRIRRLWQELEGPGLVAQNAGRPHLTLAAILPEDLERAADALADIASGLQGMTIAFDSIGVFVGKQPVLFLNPVVSAGLLALHRRVHDALRRAGVRRDGPGGLYVPGAWVPHVTLGLLSDTERLGTAVTIANGFRLRFEVRAVALGSLHSPAN